MPFDPTFGRKKIPGAYVPGIGTFGGEDSVFAPWLREVPGVLADAAGTVGTIGRETAGGLMTAGRTAAAMRGYGSYPAFPDPIRTAQQGVLANPNKLEQHDTDTQVKAAALAKPAQEQATSGQSGQRQADSTGLTPRAPMFMGTTGGSSSTARDLGGAVSPDTESHMRVKLDPSLMEAMMKRDPAAARRFSASSAGNGFLDYKPDSASGVGASTQDFSQVANPMAFQAYREGPERALLEMQTDDPFVAERVRSESAAQTAAAPTVAKESARIVAGRQFNQAVQDLLTRAMAEKRAIEDKYRGREMDPEAMVKKQEEQAAVDQNMKRRRDALATAAGYRSERLTDKGEDG